MTAQITTVIPTFRRPTMLRRAVESALSQSYPDLIVCVVDNASGDETGEVVAELAHRDSRVQYRCHPRNLGAIANFQAGLDSVETPYFSFLSDDDILLPGFYELALSELERHPRADFFCGRSVIYETVDGCHSLHPRKGWQAGFHAAGTATVRMVKSHFTWTASLFSTHVGRAAGPVAPVAAADLLFLARAAAAFSFVVSDEPCVIFNSSQHSASRDLPPEELEESFRVASRELVGMPEVSESDAQEIARYLAHRTRSLMGGRLRRSFREGDWESFDQAAVFLRRAGALHGGKLFREAIASRRDRYPWMASVARRLIGGQETRRRLRRSRGAFLPVDAVVELYSARLEEKMRRSQDMRLPA